MKPGHETLYCRNELEVHLQVSLGEDLLADVCLVGGAKGLEQVVPLGGLALGDVGKH